MKWKQVVAGALCAALIISNENLVTLAAGETPQGMVNELADDIQTVFLNADTVELQSQGDETLAGGDTVPSMNTEVQLQISQEDMQPADQGTSDAETPGAADNAGQEGAGEAELPNEAAATEDPDAISDNLPMEDDEAAAQLLETNLMTNGLEEIEPAESEPESDETQKTVKPENLKVIAGLCEDNSQSEDAIVTEKILDAPYVYETGTNNFGVFFKAEVIQNETGDEGEASDLSDLSDFEQNEIIDYADYLDYVTVTVERQEKDEAVPAERAEVTDGKVVWLGEVDEESSGMPESVTMPFEKAKEGKIAVRYGATTGTAQIVASFHFKEGTEVPEGLRGQVITSDKKLTVTVREANTAPEVPQFTNAAGDGKKNRLKLEQYLERQTNYAPASVTQVDLKGGIFEGQISIPSNINVIGKEGATVHGSIKLVRTPQSGNTTSIQNLTIVGSDDRGPLLDLSEAPGKLTGVTFKSSEAGNTVFAATGETWKASSFIGTKLTGSGQTELLSMPGESVAEAEVIAPINMDLDVAIKDGRLTIGAGFTDAMKGYLDLDGIQILPESDALDKMPDISAHHVIHNVLAYGTGFIAATDNAADGKAVIRMTDDDDKKLDSDLLHSLRDNAVIEVGHITGGKYQSDYTVGNLGKSRAGFKPYPFISVNKAKTGTYASQLRSAFGDAGYTGYAVIDQTRKDFPAGAAISFTWSDIAGGYLYLYHSDRTIQLLGDIAPKTEEDTERLSLDGASLIGDTLQVDTSAEAFSNAEPIVLVYSKEIPQAQIGMYAFPLYQDGDTWSVDYSKECEHKLVTDEDSKSRIRFRFTKTEGGVNKTTTPQDNIFKVTADRSVLNFKNPEDQVTYEVDPAGMYVDLIIPGGAYGSVKVEGVFRNGTMTRDDRRSYVLNIVSVSGIEGADIPASNIGTKYYGTLRFDTKSRRNATQANSAYKSIQVIDCQYDTRILSVTNSGTTTTVSYLVDLTAAATPETKTRIGAFALETAQGSKEIELNILEPQELRYTYTDPDHEIEVTELFVPGAADELTLTGASLSGKVSALHLKVPGEVNIGGHKYRVTKIADGVVDHVTVNDVPVNTVTAITLPAEAGMESDQALLTHNPHSRLSSIEVVDTDPSAPNYLFPVAAQLHAGLFAVRGDSADGALSYELREIAPAYHGTFSWIGDSRIVYDDQRLSQVDFSNITDFTVAQMDAENRYQVTEDKKALTYRVDDKNKVLVKVVTNPADAQGNAETIYKIPDDVTKIEAHALADAKITTLILTATIPNLQASEDISDLWGTGDNKAKTQATNIYVYSKLYAWNPLACLDTGVRGRTIYGYVDPKTKTSEVKKFAAGARYTFREMAQETHTVKDYRIISDRNVQKTKDGKEYYVYTRGEAVDSRFGFTVESALSNHFQKEDAGEDDLLTFKVTQSDETQVFTEAEDGYTASGCGVATLQMTAYVPDESGNPTEKVIKEVYLVVRPREFLLEQSEGFALGKTARVIIKDTDYEGNSAQVLGAAAMEQYESLGLLKFVIPSQRQVSVQLKNRTRKTYDIWKVEKLSAAGDAMGYEVTPCLYQDGKTLKGFGAVPFTVTLFGVNYTTMIEAYDADPFAVPAQDTAVWNNTNLKYAYLLGNADKAYLPSSDYVLKVPSLRVDVESADGTFDYEGVIEREKVVVKVTSGLGRTLSAVNVKTDLETMYDGTACGIVLERTGAAKTGKAQLTVTLPYQKDNNKMTLDVVVGNEMVEEAFADLSAPLAIFKTRQKAYTTEMTFGSHGGDHKIIISRDQLAQEGGYIDLDIERLYQKCEDDENGEVEDKDITTAITWTTSDNSAVKVLDKNGREIGSGRTGKAARLRVLSTGTTEVTATVGDLCAEKLTFIIYVLDTVPRLQNDSASIDVSRRSAKVTYGIIMPDDVTVDRGDGQPLDARIVEGRYVNKGVATGSTKNLEDALDVIWNSSDKQIEIGLDYQKLGRSLNQNEYDAWETLQKGIVTGKYAVQIDIPITIAEESEDTVQVKTFLTISKTGRFTAAVTLDHTIELASPAVLHGKTQSDEITAYGTNFTVKTGGLIDGATNVGLEETDANTRLFAQYFEVDSANRRFILKSDITDAAAVVRQLNGKTIRLWVANTDYMALTPTVGLRISLAYTAPDATFDESKTATRSTISVNTTDAGSYNRDGYYETGADISLRGNYGISPMETAEDVRLGAKERSTALLYDSKKPASTYYDVIYASDSNSRRVAELFRFSREDNREGIHADRLIVEVLPSVPAGTYRFLYRPTMLPSAISNENYGKVSPQPVKAALELSVRVTNTRPRAALSVSSVTVDRNYHNTNAAAQITMDLSQIAKLYGQTASVDENAVYDVEMTNESLRMPTGWPVRNMDQGNRPDVQIDAEGVLTIRPGTAIKGRYTYTLTAHIKVRKADEDGRQKQQVIALNNMTLYVNVTDVLPKASLSRASVSVDNAEMEAGIYTDLRIGGAYQTIESVTIEPATVVAEAEAPMVTPVDTDGRDGMDALLIKPQKGTLRGRYVFKVTPNVILDGAEEEGQQPGPLAPITLTVNVSSTRPTARVTGAVVYNRAPGSVKRSEQDQENATYRIAKIEDFDTITKAVSTVTVNGTGTITGIRVVPNNKFTKTVDENDAQKVMAYRTEDNRIVWIPKAQTPRGTLQYRVYTEVENEAGSMELEPVTVNLSVSSSLPAISLQKTTANLYMLHGSKQDILTVKDPEAALGALESTSYYLICTNPAAVRGRRYQWLDADKAKEVYETAYRDKTGLQLEGLQPDDLQQDDPGSYAYAIAEADENKLIIRPGEPGTALNSARTISAPIPLRYRLKGNETAVTTNINVATAFQTKNPALVVSTTNVNLNKKYDFGKELLTIAAADGSPVEIEEIKSSQTAIRMKTSEPKEDGAVCVSFVTSETFDKIAVKTYSFNIKVGLKNEDGSITTLGTKSINVRVNNNNPNVRIDRTSVNLSNHDRRESAWQKIRFTNDAGQVLRYKVAVTGAPRGVRLQDAALFPNRKTVRNAKDDPSIGELVLGSEDDNLTAGRYTVTVTPYTTIMNGQTVELPKKTIYVNVSAPTLTASLTSSSATVDVADVTRSAIGNTFVFKGSGAELVRAVKWEDAKLVGKPRTATGDEFAVQYSENGKQFTVSWAKANRERIDIPTGNYVFAFKADRVSANGDVTLQIPKEVRFTVSVRNSRPVLRLSQARVQLNSKFAETTRVYTSLNSTTYQLGEADAYMQAWPKGTTDASKMVRVNWQKSQQKLYVETQENAPAGTYTMALRGYAVKNGITVPLQEVKLTVNVVQTLPTVRIGNSRLRVYKNYAQSQAAGNNATGFTLNNGYDGKLEVSAFTITPSGNAQTQAEARKIGFVKDGDLLRAVLRDTSIGNNRTYNYSVTPYVRSAATQNLIALKPITISVTAATLNLCANVRAGGSVELLHRNAHKELESGCGITYTFSLSDPKVDSIARVELVDADKGVNGKDLFTLGELNPATGKATLHARMDSKTEQTLATNVTYALKFKVTTKEGQVLYTTANVRPAQNGVRVTADRSRVTLYKQSSRAEVVRIKVTDSKTKEVIPVTKLEIDNNNLKEMFNVSYAADLQQNSEDAKSQTEVAHVDPKTGEITVKLTMTAKAKARYRAGASVNNIPIVLHLQNGAKNVTIRQYVHVTVKK